MTAVPLMYKPAEEPWELDQIHRLNYETFVEEIPQHEANDSRRLVDRYDDENSYFVCRRGEQVVGMVAVRGGRPWSLDAKLPDVDRHLPPGKRFCEIRLLSIHPRYRGGAIIRGLLGEVARHALAAGYTGAVISGTVRQRRLYEHLGFVPFGPLVGSSAAQYQPMYITIEALRHVRVAFMSPIASPVVDGVINFQPGPVDIHPDVLDALAKPPISHRSVELPAMIDRLKHALCAIVGMPNVEILLGSGTLANDVVAGQLAALPGRGVVLSNGEFGDRLIDHATRAGLAFDAVSLPWGQPFDATAVDAALSRHPSAGWVWMVHLETSTSVLNDLDALVGACDESGMAVAADCVSSVGVVPMDLARLRFATAVSGKGIASVPGLALVFHQGSLSASRRLPRYLDLALYAESGSVPFTHSSNLLAALDVATRRTILRGKLADVERLTSWLRRALLHRGLSLVAAEQVAAPGIVTIALDAGSPSVAFGDAMLARGFTLAYRSSYLQRRNWVQIALMGECSRAKLDRLLSAWDELRQSRENG
jgi:aspartate aminotransferase-like enzyme/GNAT superfamily N-acetyltransferase